MLELSCKHSFLLTGLKLWSLVYWPKLRVYCWILISHFPPDTRAAMMKYILVTGGVISGIGKGIIASSVGTILKSCGLHVTAIKIDPYINIDAGTFSPYEHGTSVETVGVNEPA